MSRVRGILPSVFDNLEYGEQSFDMGIRKWETEKELTQSKHDRPFC